MPLLKTSVDEGHYHIVYLSKVDGSMLVADANGHTHQAMPDGSLGSTDGHTHYPEMAPVATVKKNTDEPEKVANEVREILQEVKDLEEDSRRNGREAYDFYNGKQWDEFDKRQMELKKRPAITINETRGKINVLRGYHISNRTDIVYRPMESSDQVIAELYTRAVKSILDRCDYTFHETRALTDALVAGRGVLRLYVDYTEDIDGEIRVEWLPWDQIYYGPHDELDLRDCAVEARVRWLKLSQAKSMFPEYADEIQESYEAEEDDPYPSLRRTGRQYDVPSKDGFKLIDTEAKRVRLVELWRKEYQRASVAVHAVDDFFEPLDGWKAKDIAAVKRLPGMSVVPQDKSRMRVTRMVGGVIVSDEYPDLPVQDFQTFPIYCYKLRDGYQGLVEDMKDLQRLENKVFSQHADILNKIAATGWFVDAQTFADKREYENFKQNASSPGFVVKVRNIAHVPVQVQPPQIPPATIQALDVAAQKMREVSNINLDIQGLNSDVQSGVAIVEKKRQSLIGNAFVFDNLSLVKKRLGRNILRLLCALYTPERLYKLIMGEHMRNPVLLSNAEGQEIPIDQIEPRVVLEALSISDPTRFDVTVDESPFNSTMRRANFVEWAQMAANGVPVPPSLLVEMSDLPNKQRAMQMIIQSQQAQADTERMKYDTEIKKALIAANSRQTAADQGAAGVTGAEPIPGQGV